jgi:ABC-type transport system substrate-binding protein
VTRLAVVVFGLALAAGCAVPLDAPPDGSAGGGGAPHAGGTFRVGFPEDPHSLDPALGYDTVSWWAEQLLFSTLVDYEEGTAIEPKLATAWEVSPDGRRLTFTLRTDVRFSTGRAMTAADVKYSLERLLTPALHSPGAEFFIGIEGAEDYVQGHAPGIRGIDAIAPDRIAFALTAVDPLFLHKLTMPFASVVDRETVERLGEGEFARHPVGTGPFMLAEWTFGQRLRFERNPYYFRPGLPYLDGILVTIGVSDQLAWFQYQRGEIDVAGIPSAEFARVTADQRYQPLLVRRTTLRTTYIGLNCEMAPFDQLAVRQAVNLAIDRQRILDLADRRGIVADAILPPDMPGFDPSLKGFPHDPAAARAKLAEAGVPAGIRTTFWVQRDDLPLRMAQSVQQDLRALGIDLRLKPVDFPALIEGVRRRGVVPIFMLGWEADFPDPSNFLTVLLHSDSRGTNNNAFYSNPEVDRLLDQADTLLDPAARLRLFHQAEVRIVQDAPWVPLIHPTAVSVRHPRVRDYSLHPLRPTRLERVWLTS